MSLWLVPQHVVEDRFHHRRRELLRAEAVPAADYLWERLQPRITRHRVLGYCSKHVLIERFASRARLFGSIKHRKCSNSRRQNTKQMRWRKRPEESNFDQTHSLSAFDHFVDCFFGGLSAGSHYDDHPCGIGRAKIVEQSVCSAGQLGELPHNAFNDGRCLRVERIGPLPRLKEDIGVLSSATHYRTIRCERA